ncbi:hypothetical protein [Streptomyces sp. NPDC000410]|uniref:WXG100 family type VII secretion target n=1 Tax=Streptomyces sp. NPDC000410 TaxID=3154254 RepID=UPI00332FE7C1
MTNYTIETEEVDYICREMHKSASDLDALLDRIKTRMASTVMDKSHWDDEAQNVYEEKQRLWDSKCAAMHAYVEESRQTLYLICTNYVDTEKFSAKIMHNA